MNDFSELEAELKQLRPVAPSPELMTRIERALHETLAATPGAGILPRRREFRVNWFALGCGVAAAAVFLVLARVGLDRPPVTKQQTVAAAQPVTSQTAPAPARTLVPDGVTRVLYNTSDEGLVYPANFSEPARRVRSRARETLQWKNPSNGASLRVSYLTEDIELIPISASGQ